MNRLFHFRTSLPSIYFATSILTTHLKFGNHYLFINMSSLIEQINLYLQKLKELKMIINSYESKQDVFKKFEILSISDKWERVFKDPHRFKKTS